MQSEFDLDQQQAAAQELDGLLTRGKVVPVLLFPARFGGADDPDNIVFLPPECLPEKEALRTRSTTPSSKERRLITSFSLPTKERE